MPAPKRQLSIDMIDKYTEWLQDFIDENFTKSDDTTNSSDNDDSDIESSDNDDSDIGDMNCSEDD